jgi:2-octaprenyl-6-methoxyphenol hydroxylase
MEWPVNLPIRPAEISGLSTATPTAVADVIVSGAGAAGLAASIALARSGFSVICAGLIEPQGNGRTVALFEGSLRFLRQIGLLDQLSEGSQPVRAIRMVDDTGPFLPVPPIILDAPEIGLDALGLNIETGRLVQTLANEAASLPNITLTRSLLSAVEFSSTAVSARDREGQVYQAKLLTAADGRRSLGREAAKIPVRTWRYRQVAITALLAHEKPHNGISTEFHTRGGPCTLVPLQGTADHPHRSSLVWLMPPDDAERRRALDAEAFASELQQQTRGIAGRITLEEPRGFFPMGGLSVNRLIGHRIVLIGEAAHAFPPLAAQGLNLTLRDIAQLLATLEAARTRDEDFGALPALVSYERGRRRDIALRTNGVDVLNRSIMTDFAPIDAVRGAGAIAVRLIGPLRRALMREGILPAGPVV